MSDKLYEYAIVHHPKPLADGAPWPGVMVQEPKYMMAESYRAVLVRAALEVPDVFKDRMPEIQFLVREFIQDKRITATEWELHPANPTETALADARQSFVDSLAARLPQAEPPNIGVATRYKHSDNVHPAGTVYESVTKGMVESMAWTMDVLEAQQSQYSQAERPMSDVEVIAKIAHCTHVELPVRSLTWDTPPSKPTSWETRQTAAPLTAEDITKFSDSHEKWEGVGPIPVSGLKRVTPPKAEDKTQWHIPPEDNAND